MIFGHFIYFGHFPIEIPIEAEKDYHHGERKVQEQKQKKILKSVSKVDQLGSLHNLKFQTCLNKNPPSQYAYVVAKRKNKWPGQGLRPE